MLWCVYMGKEKGGKASKGAEVADILQTPRKKEEGTINRCEKLRQVR